MTSDFIDQFARLEQLIKKDKRYKIEAYLFILRGLSYTIFKSQKNQLVHTHITGQQLSCGIKDFTIEEFGMAAKMVLEYWGIRQTRDFGEIVYNLIKIKLMGKTPTDKIEHFDNVFDFNKEFNISPKIDKEYLKNFRFDQVLR